MKIVIREKVTQQPNGDRDPHRHPSSAFDVILINGDKESVVFGNDQFDPWWTCIKGTRAGHLKEAQTKATEFGETLGCEVELGAEKPSTRMTPGKYVVDVKSVRMGEDGVLVVEALWSTAQKVG